MSNPTANVSLLAPEHLPDGSNQLVPDKWFTDQLQAYKYHTTEIDVLKNYHDKRLTATEAAYLFTRPLTIEPTSDHRRSLMRNELHIDGPHESMVHGNKGLEWKDLPYLDPIWRNDYCWEVPGCVAEIYYQHPERRNHEIAQYLEKQDVWAQLVAAGFFTSTDAYLRVLWALEQRPELNDTMHLYDRIIPELHVPAAASWIRTMGRTFYEDAINGKTLDNFAMLKPPSPKMALKCDHMCKDRWAFWEKRFTEFANGAGGEDELTKKEAKAAVEHMQAVVKAWEMENESIAG
ncbi:hypothetical protein D6C90_07958 [Aureobasidium pullulans]|uniref:Uncharacterized protein n=1 Tax=Aureobasidium pullulans TaxID=5580 RepID=A0A4S9U9C9_AURPU|nr:hypothetical protein D6C90_07958 [Aureobasidium pullulans]